MSVRITEEDILSLRADAAVIGVEIARLRAIYEESDW